MKKIFYLGLLLIFSSIELVAQETQVFGIVKDNTDMTIPYVSVSYANNSKGTITNEDGEFILMVTEEEKQDSLAINCLGFDTFKIKISEFLSRENNIIQLSESSISLNEIEILKPEAYITNALEKLKENTISSKHQLTLLYRRASSEEGKARFFVEHYMKIYDKGPATRDLRAIEILEARKSADYRFYKKKEFRHSVIPMTIRNPVRQSINIKKTSWKKTGDSSYEGEDVVIIKGQPKGQASYKLYIGVDTYKIYKIENLANNSLYVYKKNKDGKLYLGYHSRQWKSMETIPADLQRKLGKSVNKISATYKHEVFVLDIETNKKKMKVRNQPLAHTTDMADLKIKYHQEFWKNFVSPPDTKYFKQIKKEIESNYGVPIQTQFELVN